MDKGGMVAAGRLGQAQAQGALGPSRREWVQRAGALGVLTQGAWLAACSKGESTLSELIAQVQGIAVGHAAGKPLMVFFDTRCGYCARLWQTLQAHQGDLAMLWVPVAILSNASEREAMALLASPSPHEALRQHMQHFGQSAASHGAAGGDAERQALRRNRSVLNGLPAGRESVPQSAAAGPQGVRVAMGAQPWDSFKDKLGL